MVASAGDENLTSGWHCYLCLVSDRMTPSQVKCIPYVLTHSPRKLLRHQTSDSTEGHYYSTIHISCVRNAPEYVAHALRRRYTLRCTRDSVELARWRECCAEMPSFHLQDLIKAFLKGKTIGKSNTRSYLESNKKVIMSNATRSLP